MRRIVASLILATTIAGCAGQPRVTLPDADVYATVEARGWSAIFQVRNDMGFVGSCWHAGNGLFVTAAHVPADETALYVDGRRADLIGFDPISDVAVLRVSNFSGPKLTLGTPAIGIRARARGYSPSGGLPVQTTGTISAMDMGGGFIGFDGGIQPGMSGCPVLGDRGEVLGTVSAAHGWNEYSAFSPPNSIMGRLCDPKKIGTMLAHLSPDSPAMSLPFPPPPPPAAVQEEQIP